MVSDQFINAPSELYQHLVWLIKSFLLHRYMPENLLVCSLFPLLKDNLGDMTKSENYRAIAGGCLLIKLNNIIIILLESERLSYDELQFAYQKNTSTVMCSWSVTSVIDQHINKGVPVFGAAMDMSKAFDMVSWCELFTTPNKRQINPLIMRLMIFIYMNQECNAVWNNRKSRTELDKGA